MAAADLCSPFDACDDLDGRVLLQRAAYGPPLVADNETLPFGALALRGAAVRPYVDVHFQLRWVPRDLCYGPIASVMTLAPAETITIATRSEHRTSFTDLVRDATNSSSVSTHTRQGPDTGSSERSNAQKKMDQLAKQMQSARHDAIDLRAMYAKDYGSFLSDIGDAFVAVATGGASLIGKAVAGAVGNHSNNAVGSAGNPGAMVGATMSAISEVIDSVSRNESQSHLAESTHSTEDTTSTSVTRTITNPYRDRTLQLRFIPVFRPFEIVASIFRARLGLAMVCGHLDFANDRVGSRYAHVLATAISDTNLMRLADADVGVRAADFRAEPGELQDHLQANAPVYTKRFLNATIEARDEETVHGAFSTLLARNGAPVAEEAGDIAAGLAWSQSEVRANVLHVPLSEHEDVRSAWRLDAEASSKLGDVMKQLSPAAIGAILGPLPTETVHVYAGTHMEAVAGQCVLSDLVTDALSV